MRVSRTLFNRVVDDSWLLNIRNGSFKVNSSDKATILPKPIKSFDIYKTTTPADKPSYWAITGNAKSQFLNIVSGKYLPDPPLSRTYPFMNNTYRYDRIQFLNFQESSGLDMVYMSARYETFAYKGKLEMSDDVNSVKNYITGNNNYNNNTQTSEDYVEKLIELFNLKHLSQKWINSLSNGQLRRARIAKALIDQPDLLVIDDPFLGLDPEATELVSSSLIKVSNEFNTSIVLGLRVQDRIPEWIGHVGFVTSADGLKISGPKTEVLLLIEAESKTTSQVHRQHELALASGHEHLVPITNDEIVNSLQGATPHIEFNNASVVYKTLPIFQHFNWVVPRGSNWRILGNNGTGKTTLLSLITADHPQSWKSVMSINGVLRKTGSGVSFFDVNNKIGISSPELHALVHVHKRTMKELILNGLVENVGNSNFLYKGKPELLDDFGRKILDKFADRLAVSEDKKFIELSITDQKLTLFLRAIIKNPEILILDEAFSCMDDEEIMIRCHKLIEEELKDTTVLAIGHINWEVPRCDYLLKLKGDEARSYEIMKYTK